MKKKIEAILKDLSDSNDYNLKYIPEHNYNELVDKLNALFSLHCVIVPKGTLVCENCIHFEVCNKQHRTVETCGYYKE